VKAEDKRFSDKLIVRCPPRISPMIDRAAARKCMTSAEYIRRGIIDRLEADGFTLDVESA
jgi:hypothetical protein